jgi:hypothetical protein
VLGSPPPCPHCASVSDGGSIPTLSGQVRPPRCTGLRRVGPGSTRRDDRRDPRSCEYCFAAMPMRRSQSSGCGATTLIVPPCAERPDSARLPDDEQKSGNTAWLLPASGRRSNAAGPWNHRRQLPRPTPAQPILSAETRHALAALQPGTQTSRCCRGGRLAPPLLTLQSHGCLCR